MNARHSLTAGVCLMFLAVALGAFGAHALRNWATPPELAIWHTAVRYQAWHGLGLIGLGLWMERSGSDRRLQSSAACLLAGTLIFSMSLYGMVLGDLPVLGAITPVGGLLMLLGWGLWGWGLLRGGNRA